MATLGELKTRARQRSDQENSNFVSDVELTSIINSSYAELYDIIIATDANYYLNLVPFTISGSDYTYPLPVDFYKLKGIDYSTSSGGPGTWLSVNQFNFSERNNATGASPIITGTTNALAYILKSNELYFMPETQAGGIYRMWYIPRPPVLVVDSDVIDAINGFDEYVVVDAAIKMSQKEESDVTILLAQKQALLNRIQSMAADRDYSSPKKVSNVQNSGFGSNFLFLG